MCANEQLWLFQEKYPKYRFRGRNFKTVSQDLESLPPGYVCQVSYKLDSFEIFVLDLGKLLNYVRYFGSYNVQGVAESYVEAEIGWVELGGTGCKWAQGLKISGFL